MTIPLYCAYMLVCTFVTLALGQDPNKKWGVAAAVFGVLALVCAVIPQATIVAALGR